MMVKVSIVKDLEVVRYEARYYDEKDSKEAWQDYNLLCAILNKKGRQG